MLCALFVCCLLFAHSLFASTFFFFGIAYGKKNLVKKVKGGSESVRICKQNAFGGRRNCVRELVFLLAHTERDTHRHRERETCG